ncbi:ArsR family transcriptional regulator [Vallitalea pronyensis]|uniref:ArsR family transcriptional regulator n=1 Tax=Vallitalea pronyensis TaxID=1348613 RepID=A0A8J8SF31_9FIRM|nr:ArsR family transcriptional regulator [Vallitalea pronyensis]QUI21191.1 ArsR family transcriptional regulator [Vallitalea pronyensis]
MKIHVSSKNLKFFQCFSSETKLKIVELLAIQPRNIGELASMLSVSSTIITRHINALEDAHVIKSELSPGKRGLQKKCSLAVNEISLLFDSKEKASMPTSSIAIPVGQFTNYQVAPTCGMASPEQLIGMVDDPRYFSDPNHVHAHLLWFAQGFVEYTIPGYIFSHNSPVTSLMISLELCSEFPGYKADYPSDIYFYLDDVSLGFWTSPGDFGGKKGIYTPDWWTRGTEYGLLKTICINQTGTYVDGTKMSDVTLDALPISANHNLTLRIAVPEDANHVGGITLFGKGFGNYNQDIMVEVTYNK